MPQPPPPPPPAGRRRSRPGPWTALAVVIVLVLGAGAVVVLRGGGSSSPSTWDSRITDLVRYDEVQRGLRFKHPVPVDFLTPEEYSARTRTSGSAQLSEQDKRDLQTTQGELRAFGLIGADVDLLGASDDLADSGTLAFYDSDTKRITVRGTEMTVDLRVTLVHELVHVLQDQWFDLNKTEEGFTTSGASEAFRALVEGDATRIEDSYVADLPKADRDAYDRATASSDEQSSADLKSVPPVLQTFFAAPYALGPQAVALIAADGGNSAMDDAFRNPPASEHDLLDPRGLLGREKPVQVQAPQLPAGVSASDDEGDIGAFTWYIVLSSRLDAKAALSVVDGWAGDAFVAYQQDGRSCITADYVGADPAATRAMADALRAWTAAGPEGAAQVVAKGDSVEIQACDPGATAVAPAGDLMQALVLAELRLEAIVDAVQNGGYGIDEGWTYGVCFIEQLTPEQLQAIGPGAVDAPPQAVLDALGAISDTCATRLSS